MYVEITREQREELTVKVDMCVDFIKKLIQPHILAKDKIHIPVNNELDLYITNSDIYIQRTRFYSFGIEIPIRETHYLDKASQKKNHKYVCEACPELAVVFLQNWEKIKNSLFDEVDRKNKEEDKLSEFINNFKI